MDESNTLAGQLLIAMPGMLDPNFQHTVTYMCEHGESGAVGIVINRPMKMELGEVLEQLSLEPEKSNVLAQPVMKGGPVQAERGFVLHESSNEWESTTSADQSIYVTTSRDILNDVASGQGPGRLLMALGYAGWGAGQLEEEIRQNAWLTVPATSSLVFETPYEKRWVAAAASIGVDPASLSLHAGNA
ncbi:MAG: YqgE/AlgH family protein [Gammaproteobacteria bacterium]